MKELLSVGGGLNNTEYKSARHAKRRKLKNAKGLKEGRLRYPTKGGATIKRYQKQISSPAYRRRKNLSLRK